MAKPYLANPAPIHQQNYVSDQGLADCSGRTTKKLKAIWAGPGTTDEKRLAVHQLEMKKPADLRYPSNLDSIGIEVVGVSEKRVYSPPTAAQNAASVWLVSALLSHLDLKRTAIYRHPVVSFKLATEAAQVEY